MKASSDASLKARNGRREESREIGQGCHEHRDSGAGPLKDSAGLLESGTENDLPTKPDPRREDWRGEEKDDGAATDADTATGTDATTDANSAAGADAATDADVTIDANTVTKGDTTIDNAANHATVKGISSKRVKCMEQFSKEDDAAVPAKNSSDASVRNNASPSVNVSDNVSANGNPSDHANTNSNNSANSFATRTLSTCGRSVKRNPTKFENAMTNCEQTESSRNNGSARMKGKGRRDPGENDGEKKGLTKMKTMKTIKTQPTTTTMTPTTTRRKKTPMTAGSSGIWRILLAPIFIAASSLLILSWPKSTAAQAFQIPGADPCKDRSEECKAAWMVGFFKGGKDDVKE